MSWNLDEQLELLSRELTQMGALCESAIAASAKALLTESREPAGQVPELSAQVEQKEREIEGLCLKLLLRHQPVARDLRVISAAIKMITDMGRIGRQAADIAEIITLANISASRETLNIHAMAATAIQMVTDSIAAFVRKDTSLAREVIEKDDVVDDYFDEIKAALIGRLRTENTNSEYAIDLLMIAKYFERIGDHAVNIAKWVLFSITGSREGKLP